MGQDAQDTESEERRVLAMAPIGYQPYDLDGPLQPEITWQPISFDRASQQGSYVMRMAPGARTVPHRHPGYEDFLILEGELTTATAGSCARAISSATGPAATTTPGPIPAASSPSSNGSRNPADGESALSQLYAKSLIFRQTGCKRPPARKQCPKARVGSP
jgi:hypothetical protein